MTDYISNIQVNNETHQIGGGNFNGQWVSIMNTLVAGATYGVGDTTLVFDLSSVIPDDGYNYEVLFHAYARSGATQYADIHMFANTEVSGSVGIISCRTNYTNRNDAGQGTAIVVVTPTFKKINIMISVHNGTSAGVGISVKGYRRIGKNGTESNYINDMKVNDTSIPIGGDNFDGSFVSKNVTLNNNFTVAVHERKAFDLSSYLPDDGYDYEVWFSAHAWTGAVLHDMTSISMLSGIRADDTDFGLRLDRCVTRINGVQALCGGTCILPILASDKYVVFYNQDAQNTSGQCDLAAKGYRRIGKNGTSSDYLTNIQVEGTSIPIGGNNFDGQWENRFLYLAKQGSLGGNSSVSYDISSYIKDTQNSYEVTLSFYGVCATTNQTYFHLCVIPSDGQYYNLKLHRNCNTVQQLRRGNIIVVITPNNQTLTFTNTGPMGLTDVYFELTTCRRIGNNT